MCSKLPHKIFRRLLSLRIAFYICLLPAIAEAKPVVASLDSLYNTLLSMDGVQIRDVKFTGSDSRKSGGFMWQRGSGNGWTHGKRLTLNKVEPRMAMSIDNFFKKISTENFVIRYSDNCSATLVEPDNVVYIYEYDPLKSKLYFMRASVDDEICVPAVWNTTDSVNATLDNPLAFADKCELAQLGLSRLWAETRRNFVFMDRVKINWDSLYVANMKPVAESAKAGDDEAVGRILQLMAARLGDGHTFVYGYKRGICHTPIATILIDGHVYVDSVISSELRSEGVARGMELVSVNGMPVIEYGNKTVMPYISSSTQQWSDYQTFCGFNLLAAREGDTVRIQLQKGKKTLDVEYVPSGKKFIRPQSPRAITYSLLPGNVGYLRLANFMDHDFYDQFDGIYPDLLKSDALIIDLRGNGGGNSGNGDHVLRHLTSDSIRTGAWSSPCYVPAFASWHMEQPVHRAESGYMKPYTDRPIYDKPIVVMVDGGTFSAAEDFTAAFRGMGRGKVIGTPTGGSTGNGVNVTLIPGLAYANICSKHDVSPDGTEFVGIGIIPDIEVKETYESHFGTSGTNAVKVAVKLLTQGM